MNMFPIAKYATDSKQTGLIEKTKQLPDRLINDVHKISHGLNSDYIKINGLPQVLREELNFIISLQNMHFNIDVTSNFQSFEPNKELLIYRIAREAILNIAKHASATLVNMPLSYDGDEFTM
jgi:signal transduction histidine kinase